VVPLSRSTLAKALEDALRRRPDAPAVAASDWARAYVAYAAGALTTAASVPTNASANQSVLTGVFTAAFTAGAAAAAANLIGQGVMAFWMAIVWSGPTATGATTVPGNLGLAATLAALFADVGGRSLAEKAGRFADAFDAGARQVVVTDVPAVQPAPPIVGPIH
jgi:hypothetical protein